RVVEEELAAADTGDAAEPDHLRAGEDGRGRVRELAVLAEQLEPLAGGPHPGLVHPLRGEVGPRDAPFEGGEQGLDEHRLAVPGGAENADRDGRVAVVVARVKCRHPVLAAERAAQPDPAFRGREEPVHRPLTERAEHREHLLASPPRSRAARRGSRRTLSVGNPTRGPLTPTPSAPRSHWGRPAGRATR